MKGHEIESLWVKMILAPRIEVIRKIYAAVKDFQGAEGDPTSVTIYLGESITGKRGIQVKDAYNMAKALVKVGWLVIENDDGIAVRLTGEGVRAVG
jgi:hypothetical protein